MARYINQGRVEADHANLSARKAVGLLLADPATLEEKQHTLRDKLAATCPEMTTPATLISGFAAMLTPKTENAEHLRQWLATVRTTSLPALGSLATGLERDQDAVEAALTLPYHNGRTEGVNHKIKLLKRQTYGRAEPPLLRQRILAMSYGRSSGVATTV